MDDTSTSGPLDGQFITESENRPEYEEMACRSFSRLVKTRRQGRWFVLKGLKPELSGQAVYIELLRKEYALMVGLDHPNIVKAYAKEVDPVVGPCIVMEYIDGVSLDVFLAGNPSTQARLKVVNQLADALAYIHSKQVLHRDLKPSNILVTRNGGNVKIIDFGLSDADDYTILKQPAGTVNYMAPEQMNCRDGGRLIDCKSDIYSFGLILREVLPHRCRHIAAKCSHKDPDRRYGSMETVKDAMLRCDRRRRSLPLLCSLVLLSAAVSFTLLHIPASVSGQADELNALPPERKAYLEEAFWYINVPIYALISEAEEGETYREVMTSKISKLNLEQEARRTEMANLYQAGSPEQLDFITSYTREQQNKSLVLLNAANRNLRSFEDEFARGRIRQWTYDSLKWVVSPVVTTLGFSDITESSAAGGLELMDVSYAGGVRQGICWSPCHNPTVDCRHSESLRTGLSGQSVRIVLDSLAPGTTYFARAYVVTGAGTTYGNEVSFTTAEGTGPVPKGAARGLFTVGAGRQVFFSQGNLRYRASTDTWCFSDRQYDLVGKDNMQLSPSYDGWIDLFGWATSGYDHGAVDYQPWSLNLDTHSDELHYAYGKPDYNLFDGDGKADWGYNRIANGGDEERLWRTLRISEWVYILFNRGTASGMRFAKARVAGVNGVILLPDNWKAATYPLNSVNEIQAEFPVNVISVSDWSGLLEPGGAVFLPEAGVRTIDGVFPAGGYYSSDAAGSDAWHIFFGLDNLRPDARGHRGDGLAVRLVRDAR